MSRGMMPPSRRELRNVHPKMTRSQAVTFWNALTPQQQADFNKMYAKLCGEKLKLSHVNVDDNETIQSIVLDDKEPVSVPMQPFLKHFSAADDPS